MEDLETLIAIAVSIVLVICLFVRHRKGDGRIVVMDKEAPPELLSQEYGREAATRSEEKGNSPG